MVASCFKEPLRGWIDTITAVGVAGYPLGMGYQRMIYMPNPIIDFIPGDLCSNSILVSTAYIASLQQPSFLIYHNSSSTSNPFRLHDYWKSGANYVKFNPWEKQVRQPRWITITNKKIYKTLVYLEEDLPAIISKKIASLPLIGSKKQLDLVNKF